jgi:AcrR family transcriptional regulator
LVNAGVQITGVEVDMPAEDEGTPGEARRGRPRDPAVDEAILSATVELLEEVGYAGLTMEQVAARAGVGKASVYLRWAGKVALVTEAIRQRSGVAPPVPDTGSLGEDMRRFLRSLLRARQAGRRAVDALSEIATDPELAETWRATMADTMLSGLRTIVGRALERGELPADTDVELLSVLPLAMLRTWQLTQRHRPDRSLVDRVVKQFYTSERTTTLGVAPWNPRAQ